MTHPWDDFSKLLSESVPRRESWRRLGLVFAGALLSPLGLPTAWAKGSDPCKTFCRCRNKSQQNQCLAACRACNGNTSRLCGTCASYACCSGSGLACCDGACVDLLEDFDNCGGCGNFCDSPGPFEEGACIDGECRYQCVAGATLCNGTCTDLGGDPNNCGACGNVCPDSAPACVSGACTTGCTGYCPEGWCGGDGCGGICGCPSGWECDSNWCYDPNPNPCNFPFIPCGGVCVDPTSDRNNCGGCGVVCGPSEACIFGFCVSF